MLDDIIPTFSVMCRAYVDFQRGGGVVVEYFQAKKNNQNMPFYTQNVGVMLFFKSQ